MKNYLIIAALVMGPACAAHAEKMTGDGFGCKDKEIAARLIGMSDLDPAYLEIWFTGMKDQSCRGSSIGQEVTVEARGDGLACVRAEDDKEACFWVPEAMAPKL